MNELRRTAYLEALGIDSYVSRKQLPGAALTQRLAIVPAAATVTAGNVSVERLESNPVVRDRAALTPASASLSHGVALPGVATQARAMPGTAIPGAAAPRFSLVAMVAGDWLWLEELADLPLTTEQVRLVQAMAQALLICRSDVARPDAVQRAPAKPLVAQFDWPIHTNQQLDHGLQAARAGVAGFVGRKLEQYGCLGLVLLGQACTERVPVQELNIPTVCTASSAQILAQPALKRTVWRDLLPLVS